MPGTSLVRIDQSEQRSLQQTPNRASYSRDTSGDIRACLTIRALVRYRAGAVQACLAELASSNPPVLCANPSASAPAMCKWRSSVEPPDGARQLCWLRVSLAHQM